MKVPQLPPRKQYKSTCFATACPRAPIGFALWTDFGEFEFRYAEGWRAKLRERVGRGEFQKVAVSFHCLPSRNTENLVLAAYGPVGQHGNSTTPFGDVLLEGTMRKLFILFGFALLATSIAQAQEARGMEISGQYQYVRIYPGQGAPSASCQGAGGTFAANLSNWLGVVGDMGVCKVTGLPAGSASHEINYLFGPRLTYHNYGPLTPYAQVLLGGEKLSASVTGLPSSSVNSFAMTFGGGADFKLTPHLAFRAIQLEYLYTHFNGAKQNNLRLQSGLVYRFGR
jgi:opacity protein-like surface antigen